MNGDNPRPADDVDEPSDPQRASDEFATLTEFLDYYRAVLLRKGVGLSVEQLAMPAVPASTLTIGSLLRHMSFVEHYWFDVVLAGRSAQEPWASVDWDADPDWEMTTAKGMSFDELRSDFDAACERSRVRVSAASSLDALGVGGDPSRPTSLRWILVHMIEEYARHCGHADLLRESIDGRVGD